MRKKRITQSFSYLLAASMVATAVVPVTASAAESRQAEVSEDLILEKAADAVSRAATQDGVHDAWNQDAVTVKGTDAVNEVTEDGWLHLKAGSANGNANNNSASYPAVFVHPNTFDFTKEGFVEFDLKSEQDGAKNRFGVFLGYADPGNGMFFGYDASGWFWQKYTGGAGEWFTGGRVAAPASGAEVHVHISWTSDYKATLKLDDQVAFENEDFRGISDTLGSKIGIKASASGTDEITDVYLKNIHYTGQDEAEVDVYTVSGTVVNESGEPIEGASVSINGKKAVTDAQGTYVVEELPDGTYKAVVSKDGFDPVSIDVTVAGSAVVADPVTLKAKDPVSTLTIASDKMEVLVSDKFPSVVQYNMKGDLTGKVFYGQEEELTTIQINDQSIQVTEDNLEVTLDADKATYVMDLKAENVDCKITAELKVVDNTLEFNIVKVVNNLTDTDNKGQEMYPVQKINIPNHSLVSVRSSQDNANLKGAKVSSNTTMSGDKSVDVTGDMTFTSEDFMYGFVSNNELSAGIWSNSEHEGTCVYTVVNGGSNNTRVIAETTDMGEYKSVGLSSAEWYYDRKITPRVNGLTQTYVVEHSDMPSTKVVIAGDENADKEINWQDGAIAYRAIMNNPYKSEEIPELVNQRIAMNFGSQAANPFLTTLDGVKRVYLNTDGLGQSVLLKGYGSEGHDSGHPDYADIGTRIGGAEDMNKLLVEGKDYGAVFGIHINASEMYTEAKAFNEELSRGNYGWNWLDQGIGINGLYDLGSGAREKRLAALKEKVGDNLDFIYLDVWGNMTSGAEEAWESRKIARQITDKGWRFTTEWGATHEYDSTMQHWAADLPYGDYDRKGQNSEVMRFIRNHQKDSWIADYPSYSGAAQMPLLGGLNMTDFEGWSGRTDYENYITVMFRHNLITKFLQHYKVMKWVNGNPVNMGNITWTPEMEITLSDDAKDNTVLVKRDSNDYSDLSAYRSRTITLNGNVISKGAPTSGDGTIAGNETYLIPWYWAADGTLLGEEDQKLYHWNTKGGTTAWTLPEGWGSLSNVVVYELTDEGKTNETTVSVTAEGTITLENMKAETPYVIYKGEKGQLDVSWQSSKYIYDMGFNDSNLENYWTKAGVGTAEIADNSSANNMLKLSGEVSVTTEPLTNLTPGQRYALYIGVDNRSDARAHMTVKAGADVLATNYTERSFIHNMISSDQHHTGSGGTVGTASYFQNMYVFFTAPDAGDVTLTLSREAGTGDTYFDDVRIVETAMDVVKETDENGIVTKLYQDFENNAQGIYPFVISGPGQGYAGWVTDNRIHLSEAHGKYTQAGYGDKRVDDVLDGNWSVKINGLTQNDSMIYQTIPQNFHFEAGETYHISFDYQLGSEGTYEVRIGDGTNTNVESIVMPAAIGETKTFGFSFTASDSGQSWFGIYSTGESPDLKEFASSGDGAKNFSGYKDFILDNLKIDQGHMTISDTQVITRTAKDDIKLDIDFVHEEDNDTKVTWKSSNESVAVVDENGNVKFVGYGTAGITASAVFEDKEEALNCLVQLIKQDRDQEEYENVWTNTQETAGENGRGINVTDGNPSTIWHSQWSGNGFAVSESNPAIITVQLKQDISSYPYVAFYQRSGSNGLVQKYTYVIGNAFDSSTNTVSGGITVGPVTAKNKTSGSIEELDIPEGTTGKYLQIRVLQGNNGFAAIADIEASKTVSYDTPQEKIYLTTNKLAYVQSQKDDAQAYYEALVSEQAPAEDIQAAKDKVDALAKEADAMGDYLEALTALKEAQDALDQAQAEKDQLEGELKEKEDALKEAQDNLKEAQDKLDQAESEKNKAESEKDQAVNDKNQAESEKDQAIADKDEAEKAKAEAEKAKAEAEKAAEEARKAAEAAEKEAADKKAAAEQAEKDAANKQAAMEKAEAEAAKLKADLENAKKEIEALKSNQGSAIKAGDTTTYKNVTYKVLNAANKTVVAVKGKDVSSLNIAKAVKVNGVSCSVVEIAAGAFKNAKKLTKVTIGTNVLKIGKQAFYNAKKLKTVNIKTAKLKKVGSKAFAKIAAKAKITVPKNKKITYKNILKNKIPSKAIIK